MRKIITIHHIHNFGSVFQAWALKEYLVKLGHEVEIIDYRPSYYEKGRNLFKTIVSKIVFALPYLKRKKKFDRFIVSRSNLTDRVFKSREELVEYYRESCNLFIAGGDQLWNDYHPCGNDDCYKLNFVDTNLKIAYGTSMGRNDYSESELKKLSEEVSSFASIMLREQSTVELLSGYTNVPVSHVIDPVGLIDLSAYEDVLVKPEITEPYAVMYLADSSDLLDRAVSVLSKKLGLKIVHICGFKKKCYCDILEKDIGPEEILGYIKFADFVISASFHATMFSLLFNKQFATLLPGEKTNARIEDLLEKVKLSERIIKNSDDISVIEKTINFDKSNDIIARFAEESRALLASSIEGITQIK